MVAAVVDSGAEETVAPPGLFPGERRESAMQRAGGRYRAANGSRIPNVGEQLVEFLSTEGHRIALNFQLAEVERPLISVSHLSRAGNKVEFNGMGGKITHLKSERVIKLRKVGGTYVLVMQVPVADGPAAFRRHG